MKSRQLAVFSAAAGLPSETFIHRHMQELLPGKTVVVVRKREPGFDTAECEAPSLVLDECRKDWRWFRQAGLFAAGFTKNSPVQATVLRFLEQHGVEVILSEYLHLSLKWIGMARRAGIRYFAHAHGYDVSQLLRDPQVRRQYLLLDSADGVITMSEVSRQRLIGLGLDGSRIHVIPYGVDVPAQFRRRPQRDQVRCLAVGRLVGKKAPLLLLQSFREALKSMPQLKLDVVGDGPQHADVCRFISDHDLDGAVALHGSRPNSFVQTLMQDADIFVQHSRTDPESGDEEGLPVAILEAMANGLPVVATRHAGIPEAVIDGTTGLLGDECDLDAMTRNICRLAADPALRQRHGYQGWLRARAHFAWERERGRLLELLGLADSGAAAKPGAMQ